MQHLRELENVDQQKTYLTDAFLLPTIVKIWI